MPRQARLDAPGTVHHVILRGLERGQIVADRADREAFLARLDEVAAATGTTLYAWALLPNHAHLLLRSGSQGLPQFMCRLSAARGHLAAHLVTQLGLSVTDTARQLGCPPRGSGKLS